ncbi:hypothetical protein [Paraburkholderia youngii]|uniref:hypothetical protein n=1 Tax=Paraburkholderia youngii TaxID=2782701 RepID=UPI003D238155
MTMRDKTGHVVMFDSPEPLGALFAAFGPMLALTIDEAREKNPVYHVRPGAIVAVRHPPAGSARIWLANGDARYIAAEPVAALADLVGHEVSREDAVQPDCCVAATLRDLGPGVTTGSVRGASKCGRVLRKKRVNRHI